MTNNGTGQTGNYQNLVYDSNNDGNHGRKRIGVSAPEIELLNEIPSAINSGNNVSNQTNRYNTQTVTSSVNNQQNNYQTLSTNWQQPKPNFIYKDENDQQLGSAVDKLLDKYAPDANPHKLSDISNNRQPPPQVNVLTARDQPTVSTFQTNTSPPPPPITSAAANNYSTIIRPNTGQTSQRRSQNIPYNNNSNNNNNQRQSQTRPASSYDSFQHVIPPTQQQQQQQQRPQQQQQQQQRQPQAPITVKTRNGNIPVVPGKLYTIHDDPLYILYDRQNITHQTMPPKNTPKSASTTTFQPSSNFQTDPLSLLYADSSQRYPKQSVPLTTDTNINSQQTFDLGNLIKRVQADYFREIQPYVTSVKFIEKDRELGQSVDNIGITTPITIGKGFTGQADAILRRSFGRPHASQPTINRPDPRDQIHGNNNTQQRPTLEKFDSKQSFTSVTSVTSSSESSYDEDYTIGNDRKKKVQVHNQGTSPPPKFKQTQAQPQIQNPPNTFANVPSKFPQQYGGNNAETTARPVPIKLAKRISSERISLSSAGSATSNDHDDYSATYNEHEYPNNTRAQPTETVAALATSAPLIKPDDEAIRERNNLLNQGVQRSEDIHPTPPTIRPRDRNGQPFNPRSDSDKSDSALSGSGNVSESDDGSKSTTYNPQPAASGTSRSNAPQVPYSTPAGRDAQPPPTIPGGRDAQPTSTVPGGRDSQPLSTIPGGRDAQPPSTIPGGRDTQPPSNIPSGRDSQPPSNIPGGRGGPPPSTIPGGRDSQPPSTIPGGRDAQPPSTIPGGRDSQPPSNIPGGRGGPPPSTIPGGRDSQPPSNIPGGRDSQPPSNIPGGRGGPTPSTIPGGRDSQPPSNIPGGRDSQPPSNARTTTEVNARQGAPPGANPNIHFVPPDQRSAVNDRNAQAAGNNPSASTGAAAQTGSTRFFQSDKGGKNSGKDGSSTIGSKIKSLFNRKKSQ